jgi:hypothetical protein
MRKYYTFSLGKCEYLDDECISITLAQKAPSELKLPQEHYHGVRVFYRVTGKIRPL